MLFSRRAGLALIALAAASVAGCNLIGGGGETPQVWANRVAPIYLERRPAAIAAVARLADGDGIKHVMDSLASILGDTRFGVERAPFVLGYRPIWRQDKVVTTEWDARAPRIAAIPPEALTEWRNALTVVNGESVSDLTTIGLMIDTPSLFNSSNAFQKGRSDALIARLQHLSTEPVGIVAATLNLDKAWAALLIVDNDGFFNGQEVNPDKLAQAMQALGAATATPTPATPATPASP